MLDLSAIPIVDQHAHNLLRPEQLDSIPYPAAFTEGYDAEVVSRHARETLFFRRSLREIATVLDCAPDLASVLATRQQLGFDEVARRFFEPCRFEALLLDDGLLPERALPVAWHARFARVYRLVRVEQLAEALIGQVTSWDAFWEAFRAALEDLPGDVVGLKSIVAYRTGLEVELPDPKLAEVGFRALRRRAEAGEAIRLAMKPLNDWVVEATLTAAARRGRPVQFHTGFGDPDLDLRLANPLHLRPLLEDPAWREVPFILLHASYPFTREAGYLAAVYPNVYVDLGLAIPFLSVAGMENVVRTFLELTPLSKIIFSTDAHFVPELFYLGASWGRRALGGQLERAVRDGDLTAREADTAAEAILGGNARALYGLSGRQFNGSPS